MTAVAPSPVESQILQFKHLFKLKVHHDTSKNTYQKPTNLIAISVVYGLTFVGEQNSLNIIASKKLFEETSDFNLRTVIQNYCHRSITLPASPTHIDINAEQKLLAVAYIHNDVPLLRIYVIESFFTKDITHFPEIRLSYTNGTYISDLSWNPGIPNILACCISDGSLTTYTFHTPDNFEIKSLPKESFSVCVCWSPKGKQIVVGNYNGYLTQYLPELKAVKNFPPPTGLFPKSCTLCSIKWISNFQFIGVYKTQEQSLTDDEDIKSCVVVINTPKNGPVTYVNYDDVCFSEGTERPVQFYFSHIPAWNLIFVSSSNSLEVAVLGLSQDGVTWVLWNLEPEESKITLPFLKSGEAYPIGVAIDYSFPIKVPIGDKPVSMPALSVITCEGLLCIYLINYLNPAAPNVCMQANNLPSLQYFTSDRQTYEEPVQVQTAEVIPSQPLPVSQDMSFSGFNYTREQSVPPAPEVLVNTVQNQLQVPSSNLLNKLNSAFNFETSIAKGMVSESNFVSTSENTVIEPTVKPVQQSSSSVPSSSSEVTGVVKKPEPPKPRQEAVKKLKKRASVFENDIQEIKYLVSNINVTSNKSGSEMKEKFTKLENESRKLKTVNAELRNDLDVLRTSIIEVFACVQDVKSKQFQFMNPGYQSLSGIQDIDPISANNLKSIKRTIHYTQTQVEKANKQLEEMWFKVSQNPATPRTKVPILENVYETMVKQQKILGYLKAETEKFEKNFTMLVNRLIRENNLITNTSSNTDVPWSSKKLMNENMSLDDLTKKALNLNVNDQLDVKQLALTYSREHAKRYYLSYAKQLKLQELHSTSGVTYIQSSRLQRLKKKSLIILSKSVCTPQTKEEIEEIIEKPEETPRTAMISPVSSDDEKSPAMSSVISSTPLKNNPTPRFNPESTLPVEPSIIKPITSTSTKPTFSLPTSTLPTSIKPSNQDNVRLIAALTAKNPDPTPTVEAVALGKTIPSFGISDKGNTIFAGKSSAPMAPMFPSLLQSSSTASSTLASASTTVSPATTTRTLFSGIDTGTNVASNVKPPTSVTTTQGLLFPNFGSSSLFSSVVSSPATNVNPVLPTTVSAAASPVKFFSFALPKTETSTPAPMGPMNMPISGSIFGGKPIPAFVGTNSVSKPSLPAFGVAPNVVVSSSPAAISGGSLFKTVATTSSLPSFGSLAATVATTASTLLTQSTSVSEGASVSATFTVASTPTPATTSIFGSASLFSKPTSISDINFGAMLSGSTFAEKPASVPIITASAAATTTPVMQKNSAFSTFSFASNPATSSVVISEVTNDDEKDTNKENVEVAVTPPKTSFSFANIGSTISFSPVEVVSSESKTASATFNTSVISTPPNDNVLSFNAVTPTAANASIPNASAAFSVTSKAVTPTPPVNTVVATVPTTTTITSSSGGGAFDNTSSFFGGLKLGPAGPANTSVNTPIFGKASTVSAASTVPSIFSGGANIFSQAGNTATTSTAESKPIFGSGTTTPLFGQSSGAPVENKNLFSATSTSNFQSSGSMFASGGSMFGGNSNFSNSPTTQATAFASNTGGSMFGSGFSSPFQGTRSGFGSPPFSNNLQQQSPNTGGGFGSPPSFSSVFNKTGSTFPAFGSAPTFGGSPSFGSSPTKVFGQTNSNLGTFGNAATAQQQTGFENLANENTLTFGNLAQQQPSGFGSPPSFGNTNSNNTFGSPPNFGSSSFSSWR